MVDFIPLNDYIVVERACVKGSTLIRPDSEEPVSDEVFEVKAIGPGSDDYPVNVKVNDLVCISGYINTFAYKGTKAILARSRDVICKVVEYEG